MPGPINISSYGGSSSSYANAYKGVWDASLNVPDIDNTYAVEGDFYYVSTAGSTTVGGISSWSVHDTVIFDGTDWRKLTNTGVSVEALEASTFQHYDAYVKATASGTMTGSALYPYASITTAIAAASDGDTILIDGAFTITSAISLPSDKSLNFVGTDGSSISYASYNASNGNTFSQPSTAAGSKQYGFKNLIFKNAGGYAIHIKSALNVDVEDCLFKNNGWSGLGLSTASAEAGSVLGYDSSQVNLQSFAAGSSVSDGGALLVETSTSVSLVNNIVSGNFRGLRMQDCGINGSGFVSRNRCSNNIESGIYLAPMSLGGCQNITISTNYSGYNSNNGILVIGGINNKIAQNQIQGNWNAGVCAFGSANLTIRNSGLYDNNRSEFSGIGNAGDAKASIQIDNAYDLDGTVINVSASAQFIAEILGTQVHYTGLGSNTTKTGVLISAEVGTLADSDSNIVKINNVSFVGQDYAVDFSEADLSNLRVSLSGNTYERIGTGAVKPPAAGQYSELPFSSHMTEVPVIDVVVDVLKQSISFHEGVGGNLINVYGANELSSVLLGSKVNIIQKSSNRIQLRDLTLGNVFVNGVVAGVNLSTMNDTLNAAFSMSIVQYKDFLETDVGVAGSSATYYYIESPDDNFEYPLFKTEEEANDVDLAEGGSGTSSTITYLDDASGTTWYHPTTNFTNNGSSAPLNGIWSGQTNVVWNIQPTEDDSVYAPTFSSVSLNVQEGDSVNIVYKTGSDTDTYNITGVPAGYANSGTAIIGTAEDIANGGGNTVQHVLSVTRANEFGSSVGTITINVLADMLGNEFQIVEKQTSSTVDNITLTQDGGGSEIAVAAANLAAGSTYKFFLDHSSVEAGDAVEVVLTSDPSTAYTTGVTSSGTVGDTGAHVQLAIPSDVPPVSLKWTSGSGEVVTRSLTISGSTYIVNVTGATSEGPEPLALHVADEDNWYSIDETLGANERFVMTAAFMKDLAEQIEDGSSMRIGIKKSTWVNTLVGSANPSGFRANLCIFIERSGSVYNMSLRDTEVVQGSTVVFTSLNHINTDGGGFIEIDSAGDNIRMGLVDGSSSDDPAVTSYSDWSGNTAQTGDQGYGITSVDVMIFWEKGTGGEFNYSLVDWTALSEITTPALTAALNTNWTKAADFDTGNNRMNSHRNGNDIPLASVATARALPTSGQTVTAGEPWAVACVFQYDGSASVHSVYSHSSGNGNTDSINTLGVDSSGNLQFRIGLNQTHNVCELGSLAANTWVGVYVESNGATFVSPTASDLEDTYRFKLVNLSTGAVTDITHNWTTSTNRTATSRVGYMYVGQNSTLQPLVGKIASLVSTTLRVNVTLPTDAEVADMVRNPIKWLGDYKVGVNFRETGTSTGDYSSTFALDDLVSAKASHVILMGDGTSDVFPNFYNQTFDGDTSRTYYKCFNMVAGDIQTVSIPGLS
jgi:hypothetical protein